MQYLTSNKKIYIFCPKKQNIFVTFTFYKKQSELFMT